VHNSSFKPPSFETLNLRHFKNLCPSSFRRQGRSSNSSGYRAKCHTSDGIKQCSRSPVLLCVNRRDRTQSRFSQNTVPVQSEKSRCCQNTVPVQSEHSIGLVGTKSRFSQNTVSVQSEHSPGLVRTQSRFGQNSFGADRTQSWFSRNTVPVQSKHRCGSVRTHSQSTLACVKQHFYFCTVYIFHCLEVSFSNGRFCEVITFKRSKIICESTQVCAV
jgi:hypothetical protein